MEVTTDFISVKFALEWQISPANFLPATVLFSFVAITVIFLLLGSPAIASFGISITIPDINYKYIINWY